MIHEVARGVRIDIDGAAGGEDNRVKPGLGDVEPGRRRWIVEAGAAVGLDVGKCRRQLGRENRRLFDAEAAEAAVRKRQGHDDWRRVLGWRRFRSGASASCALSASRFS